MREWETIGASYKAHRMHTGHSLREWAKKRGYSIMDASRAERGLIDPRALSANVTVDLPRTNAMNTQTNSPAVSGCSSHDLLGSFESGRRENAE